MPAFAPVIVSVPLVALAFVPVIVKEIAESFPAEVIEIFLAYPSANVTSFLTVTPAVTAPAGFPPAAICVIVWKNFDPVAIPALAPVIASVCAALFTSVPVTVKAKLESLSADVIVTILAL